MASGFFVRHDYKSRRFTGGKSKGLQEVNGGKAAASVPLNCAVLP